MTIVSSGEIGLDDIVTEFTGDTPHGLKEYYKEPGGITTGNNINVPISGAISIQDFYSAIRIITKFVSVDTTNLVMTALFNSSELASTAPLQVIINSGVSIGSNSVSLPACKTGTGNTGTLTLINNGSILGAGGAPGLIGVGGVGGNAFQADVAVTIENNFRIWAGGGGGGKGGQGADVRYYPENVLFKYNVDFNDFWVYTKIAWLDSDAVGKSIVYWYDPYISAEASPQNLAEFTYGGYRYQKGTFQVAYPDGGYRYYEVRRCFDSTITGGDGGNGGKGAGFDLLQSSGNVGSLPTNGCQGGTGGNGGDWGVDGTAGANGFGANPTYQIEMVNERSGYTLGTAGYYVINNGNVTWTVTGDRKGKVG